MSKSMQGRQLKILKAIVDEYVATEEPVGSKTLATRSGLGVSPATIRNEMAVLEDAGLITQPHTSAGRIPTNKGYRVFVDQLSEVKPLSNPERKAIENFLDGATDLDDVISRTVKLLAQVTKQVAVVQYPSLVKAKVRHIELVLLNSSRLMVILITDTGRVEQRMVELPFDITEGSLADLHMARANQDLSNSMQSILESLEEQVVLLRLLSGSNSSVRVKIGDEQSEKGFKNTSLVTVGYAEVGALGILGPTRMDYASSISAVNAVANYVGRFLTENK